MGTVFVVDSIQCMNNYCGSAWNGAEHENIVSLSVVAWNAAIWYIRSYWWLGVFWCHKCYSWQTSFRNSNRTLFEMHLQCSPTRWLLIVFQPMFLIEIVNLRLNWSLKYCDFNQRQMIHLQNYWACFAPRSSFFHFRTGPSDATRIFRNGFLLFGNNFADRFDIINQLLQIWCAHYRWFSFRKWYYSNHTVISSWMKRFEIQILERRNGSGKGHCILTARITPKRIISYKSRWI